MKSGLFLNEWTVKRIKILETPYNIFLIKDKDYYSMLIPKRVDTAMKIRIALDKGYSPFTLDWFGKDHGNIGSNEVEYIEIGDFGLI